LRKKPLDLGLSDALGAVILISVVALGITVGTAAFLSQQSIQKVPAVSAEVTTYADGIQVYHAGGDTLRKDDVAFMMNGVDKKNYFIHRDGSGWSTWSAGESLYYNTTGQTLPQNLELVFSYIGGSGQTGISLAIPPPLEGIHIHLPPTGPVTEIPTSTSTTSPTGTTPTPVPPVPVSADFSANPLTGVVPLTVQFTDASTGPVISRLWTFGDGYTSTDENPVHQYVSAGTYDVTLAVSNGSEASSLARAGYIVVNLPPPPVVAFSGTPRAGTAPLTVQFTDASTGSPTAWDWNFGDGGTSITQNPGHTYTTYGNYTVNLTATNTGGSNMTSAPGYIRVCWGDNFDDNAIGTSWTFVRGTWIESGGILSQTSTATADPIKAIVSNSGASFGTSHVITAKVRINSWVEGADMSRGGVSLFTSSADDGNGYNLVFHNNHNNLQFLDDKVMWLTPGYTYPWTSGTWYWYKLKMENGILYGKVWQDGSGEPTGWLYTWTRSGRGGYPALNGGSANSEGYSTVSFDDVSVCPV
jgi:PKD repeat protein